MSKIFIYIPTYERQESLKNQLLILKPQILKYKDSVRVLVRDNNSEGDYFLEISQEFQGLENISFEKNFGNIDGNANIALGFSSAKEDEFIWLLSDNDIIKENAIEYLLEQINCKFDFILFNYTVTQPKEEVIELEDGFIKIMDGRMGLISDALYNANSIRNSIRDAFYYHNSSFPHLAVAFSTIKKIGRANFLILPRDCVHSKLIDCDVDDSKNFYPNYSLGQVGMPQLLPFFSKKSAKIFSLGWAREHSKSLYLHKEVYPGVFFGSKMLLRKNGGFFIHFYLMLGKIYAILNPVTIMLINIAKKRLSKKLVSFLKKIRKVL